MNQLRELGIDLLNDSQFERALGVFAETVRRVPGDHRSRMLAARCFAELGQKERAVMVLQACAEGLLHRDYLLSAIAACKQAIELGGIERRLHDTLVRAHARAVRAAPGKAAVPPPLPPETLYDGKVQEDLMGVQGEALSDRAIEVLGAPDAGAVADPAARPPLPLFADLEQDAFVDLVIAMGYRVYAPGDAIAVQGHGGDSIFVIVAGKAEVGRQSEGRNRILGSLGGGSIFGEISLITGASPTATVTARGTTEVFEIRREHLNALAKTHPSVPNALAEFAQQRMARNLIATSPVLQQIPETDRATVLRRFAFRALQTGETALVEGQHSPGVFLVLAGELVVQKEDPAGGVVSLGILREGDVAGEISLLTGLRATATVVATRKTATAFLERSAFDQLIAEFPQLKSYLETLSNRRLQQIGQALRPLEIIDADELVVEPQNEPPPASSGPEAGQ